MYFLRLNGERIFTSSGEVISYYSALIDKLTPKLKGITEDDYKTIRAEITDLRQELAGQLKNFGYHQADDYFNEAMANAESTQEYYELSNAYETLLLAQLTRIREKLHSLRMN